jgi:putative hydrolase of the HAD superfamily
MEGLIRGTGLRPYFEFVLDSGVEGVEKPDPEIFLRACQRMALDPGACLYVGDLFPVDVVGARSAGLAAVLLDPSGTLDFPVDRIPNVAAVPGYVGDLRGRRSPGPRASLSSGTVDPEDSPGGGPGG